MSSIDSLIRALDERTIAVKISRNHNDARVQYRLDSSVVESWPEFETIIGQYFNHHYSQCVSSGGRLDPGKARSRAKEIIEREYRRRHGDIASAYEDAVSGTNGGLGRVLDTLANGILAEAIEDYVRDQFDSFIQPISFEEKVSAICALFSIIGPHLASSVQLNRPERYAKDYRAVIEAYTEGLRQTSSVFRRL
jgi:hypothetical protein